MAQQGRRNADEALLLALACGATVEAAAQKAGISQATAYRRLAEPAFRQRLQEVRADLVQRTAGALTAAAQEAVRTLLALQKDNVPAAVRLGAARAVLEIGVKLRESAELAERVAALEAQLGQAPQRASA
jgi:hypothetical protein